MATTEMPMKRQRKHTRDRITVEALVYYAPIFKAGDEAEQRLLEGGLTPQERNRFETQARLKDLAVKKIAALSGPLITSELNKIIAGSHLPYSDDLFDLLYYAGLTGLVKGLRHFDEDKVKASATNYLFQWFGVYAKRELSIAEAPFGVAPSRFQKFKKISAVRKKLSEELGREATDEEVHEYFISGKADLKTMNGRVSNAGKPSQANKAITLELVVEQKEFEHMFLHTELLDPQADYSTDVKLSKRDAVPFSQTVFGVFSDLHRVTRLAQAVLLSELGSGQISEEDSALASTISPEQYKLIATAWKDLIRDPAGPFYTFLKSLEAEQFEEFDIMGTIRQIESSHRSPGRGRYKILFEA